jgi:hypothetical protein
MTKKEKWLNPKIIVVVVFVVLIALGEGTVGLARTGEMGQASTRESWLNIPASPLELRWSPSKRDLELFNRSSGSIVEYRMGCVREAGWIFKVIYRSPPVETNLDSGRILINSFTVYSDIAKRCAVANTRLSVIKVSFKDGSVWKL